MFLAREELEELTERKTKAQQLPWLHRNAVPFFIGAHGHPRVLRAYVQNVLSGRPEANEPQPNFAALEG